MAIQAVHGTARAFKRCFLAAQSLGSLVLATSALRSLGLFTGTAANSLQLDASCRCQLLDMEHCLSFSRLCLDGAHGLLCCGAQHALLALPDHPQAERPLQARAAKPHKAEDSDLDVCRRPVGPLLISGVMEV